MIQTTNQEKYLSDFNKFINRTRVLKGENMKCINKECEYRMLNGGDEISDFYFCKFCGITVERGQEECLIDEFEREDNYES